MHFLQKLPVSQIVAFSKQVAKNLTSIPVPKPFESSPPIISEEVFKQIPRTYRSKSLPPVRTNLPHAIPLLTRVPSPDPALLGRTPLKQPLSQDEHDLIETCRKFCPLAQPHENRAFTHSGSPTMRRSFATMPRRRPLVTYKTGLRYSSFGSIKKKLCKTFKILCGKPKEKESPAPTMKMRIVADKKGKTQLEVEPVKICKSERVTPKKEPPGGSKKLLCVRKCKKKPTPKAQCPEKPCQENSNAEIVCPEPPDPQDPMCLPYYFKKVCVKSECGKCVKYEMQRVPIIFSSKTAPKSKSKPKKCVPNFQATPPPTDCAPNPHPTKEGPLITIQDLCEELDPCTCPPSKALPKPCETKQAIGAAKPCSLPKPCEEEKTAEAAKPCSLPKPCEEEDICKEAMVKAAKACSKPEPCMEEDVCEQKDPCEKEELPSIKPNICEKEKEDPCKVQSPCKKDKPCPPDCSKFTDTCKAVDKKKQKVDPESMRKPPCERPNNVKCPAQTKTKQPEAVCDKKEIKCCPKFAFCCPSEGKEGGCAEKSKSDGICEREKKPESCKAECEKSKTKLCKEDGKKNDPCANKEKRSPCKSEETKKCDPCKGQLKQDDQCSNTLRSSDPCKKESKSSDPCGGKPKTSDPCKRKGEKVQKPCDPCKKKSDHCDPCANKSKSKDSCDKKKKDPCKDNKKSKSCDPCKKLDQQGDQCKKKSEDPCKGKKKPKSPCEQKRSKSCDPCVYPKPKAQQCQGDGKTAETGLKCKREKQKDQKQCHSSSRSSSAPCGQKPKACSKETKPVCEKKPQSCSEEDNPCKSKGCNDEEEVDYPQVKPKPCKKFPFKCKSDECKEQTKSCPEKPKSCEEKPKPDCKKSKLCEEKGSCKTEKPKTCERKTSLCESLSKPKCDPCGEKAKPDCRKSKLCDKNSKPCKSSSEVGSESCEKKPKIDTKKSKLCESGSCKVQEPKSCKKKATSDPCASKKAKVCEKKASVCNSSCAPKCDPCTEKLEPVPAGPDPCERKCDSCKEKPKLCPAKPSACEMKQSSCERSSEPKCDPCAGKLKPVPPEPNPCGKKSDPCKEKPKLCPAKPSACEVKQISCESSPKPKCDPCAGKLKPQPGPTKPCASTPSPCRSCSKPKCQPSAEKSKPESENSKPCESRKGPTKCDPCPEETKTCPEKPTCSKPKDAAQSKACPEKSESFKDKLKQHVITQGTTCKHQCGTWPDPFSRKMPMTKTILPKVDKDPCDAKSEQCLKTPKALEITKNKVAAETSHKAKASSDVASKMPKFKWKRGDDNSKSNADGKGEKTTVKKSGWWWNRRKFHSLSHGGFCRLNPYLYGVSAFSKRPGTHKPKLQQQSEILFPNICYSFEKELLCPFEASKYKLRAVNSNIPVPQKDPGEKIEHKDPVKTVAQRDPRIQQRKADPTASRAAVEEPSKKDLLVAKDDCKKDPPGCPKKDPCPKKKESCEKPKDPCDLSGCCGKPKEETRKPRPAEYACDPCPKKSKPDCGVCETGPAGVCCVCKSEGPKQDCSAKNDSCSRLCDNPCKQCPPPVKAESCGPCGKFQPYEKKPELIDKPITCAAKKCMPKKECPKPPKEPPNCCKPRVKRPDFCNPGCPEKPTPHPEWAPSQKEVPKKPAIPTASSCTKVSCGQVRCKKKKKETPCTFNPPKPPKLPVEPEDKCKSKVKVKTKKKGDCARVCPETNPSPPPPPSKCDEVLKHTEWTAVPIKGEKRFVTKKKSSKKLKDCKDAKATNTPEKEKSTPQMGADQCHQAVPRGKKRVSPKLDKKLPEQAQLEKDLLGGAKGLAKSICEAICPGKKGGRGGKKAAGVSGTMSCPGVPRIPQYAGLTLPGRRGGGSAKGSYSPWPLLAEGCKSDTRLACKGKVEERTNLRALATNRTKGSDSNDFKVVTFKCYRRKWPRKL